MSQSTFDQMFAHDAMHPVSMQLTNDYVSLM